MILTARGTEYGHYKYNNTLERETLQTYIGT